MKEVDDHNIKFIRNLLIDELVKALHSNAPHIKDSQLRIISVSFEDNTFQQAESLEEYWGKFREKFASYGYQLPANLVINGRNYCSSSPEYDMVGGDRESFNSIGSSPATNVTTPNDQIMTSSIGSYNNNIQNYDVNDLLSNDSNINMDGLSWNHHDFELF